MLYKKITFLTVFPVLLVCALVLVSCDTESNDEGKVSGQEAATTPPASALGTEAGDHIVPSGSTGSPSVPVRIAYDYKGEFGIYGMADTAEAYAGEALIAKARLLRLLDARSGPKDFEVEEEHYSDNGNVVYNGKIIFKYNMGDWVVSETQPISGRPRFSVFRSWPAGN